jgi:hypothetical protein
MLNTCWSSICVEREVRTVFGSAELSAESASLSKLDVWDGSSKQGRLPVLWVLEELMLPMLNVIDRHCSPWRFEFLRGSYNSFLIDMDVFVIVFELESAKTLDQ